MLVLAALGALAAVAAVAALLLSLDESVGYPPWLRRHALKLPWQGILSPSLGLPALLDSSSADPPRFEAVVVTGTPDAGPGMVSARLIPAGAGGPALDLDVELVEAIPLRGRAGAAQWSEWVASAFPTGVRIVLRAGAGTRQSVTGLRGLFDLEIGVGPARYRKENVVFLSPGIDREVRLLIASDIHVATRWDDLEKDVDRLFPARAAAPAGESLPATYTHADFLSRDAFRASFVNPNRALDAFVRKANALFDRGEVDAVLFLGDLVDYKFPRPRVQTPRTDPPTEWSLLRDRLLGRTPGSERLRAPLFTSTGNHDYRLYPYSLQVYGLRHCGVPDAFTAECLHRAGLHRRGTYRLDDLDAVRIDSGTSHSLDVYAVEFNPKSNYAFSAGGTSHLLLDTGPDAFCRTPEHLATPRRWSFLAGLWHAIEQPNSNGLDRTQVGVFRSYLGGLSPKATALVYLHAPFINNGPENPLPALPGEEHPLGVAADLRHEPTAAAAMAFERRIGTSGLGISTMFRDPLPLLHDLAAREGPAAVISGHVHHDVEFGLDRTNGQLYFGNYSADSRFLQKKLADRILLLEGTALGHLERSYQEGSVPSFRILHVRDGAIHSLGRLPVFGQRPFPHVRLSSAGGAETVAIAFAAPAAGPAEPDRYRHTAVFFFLDADGRPAAGLPADLEVLPGPDDRDAVTATRRIRGADGMADVHEVRGLASVTFSVRGRPKGVQVALATESFERTTSGYRSLGLVWHANTVR